MRATPLPGATRHFTLDDPAKGTPTGRKPHKVKRKEIIILEDLNFGWARAQMTEFRQLWGLGQSIPKIAKYFGRQDDEVLLLMIHEARQGNVSARPGGIFGQAKSIPL